MENKSSRYNIYIWIVSIIIPVVVAFLFTVRIPNVEPLRFLPPIYATINGLTAILLIIALWAIKNKNIKLHEGLMKIAIALSGEGALRYVYFFILITHIVLSIGVIPMVLITYVRAFSKQFESHKKIARYTFPIWLYIAVTGVIVYLMISPYYA